MDVNGDYDGLIHHSEATYQIDPPVEDSSDPTQRAIQHIIRVYYEIKVKAQELRDRAQKLKDKAFELKDSDWKTIKQTFRVFDLQFDPHQSFQTNQEIEKEYDDERQMVQKAIDVFSSLIRDFKEGASALYTMATVNPPIDRDWNENSEGLVVFIHGLSDFVMHGEVRWYNHIQFLKEHPNIDIYAPSVLNGGMCSLDSASDPIIEKILTYTKQFPDKKVCVIAHSNGGRIADKIDLALRTASPNTAVKISTIAGVHFGSPLLDYAKALGLHHIYRKGSPIWDELTFGSPAAVTLMDEVLAPLPEGVIRDYDFYASTEDFLVPFVGSAIPSISKGESRFVLHGHGHASIISAVSKDQMQKAIQWITR